MNKHFFELPKAVKRAVWAALMAPLNKATHAHHPAGVNQNQKEPTP